ncbi:MAG: hypothetical protein ACE5GJ_01840 [Gemmatimonadota bacterium]
MKGFTLVEIVVAVVILEVGILGAVGTLILAHRTLAQAWRMEAATAQAVLLLDSLERTPAAGRGAASLQLAPLRGGRAGWNVGPGRDVVLWITDPAADTLLVVVGTLAGETP